MPERAENSSFVMGAEKICFIYFGLGIHSILLYAFGSKQYVNRTHFGTICEAFIYLKTFVDTRH